MPRGRPLKYKTEEERREAKALSEKKYKQSEKGKAVQRRADKKRQGIHRKLWNKNRRLQTVFGITLDDYNQMFAEQKGCCAICGRHQSEFKLSLAVDHNSETGKIRKLLCGSCNIGLGMFQHESELLRKAATYLKENE